MITIPLILPLIPILGWVVAGAASALVVKKVFFEETEVKKVKEEVHSSKKIAILGLHQAGKTTFLNFLQGNRNNRKYVASGIEEYDSFKIAIGDKTIIISKNIDIGGGMNFVKNYETVLKDVNLSFFLFDISLFLSDNQYFRDFCARVDYLKGTTNVKTCFIATHPDKLPFTDGLKIKISEKLVGKRYKDYVEERLFVINLLNENETTEFVNKVFL